MHTCRTDVERKKAKAEFDKLMEILPAVKADLRFYANNKEVVEKLVSFVKPYLN